MEPIRNNQTFLNKINVFMKELRSAKTAETKKAIYETYKESISNIKAQDIFNLAMYNNESKESIETILESADKFVNIFHTPLTKSMPKDYDSTLFNMYIQENNAIAKHFKQMKPLLLSNNFLTHLNELIFKFEQCLEIERKFTKKEHILFAKVEEKVETLKPLQVLWALYDEAKKLIKEILTELKKEQPSTNALNSLIGRYYYLIIGINQKEELILLPNLDKLLSTEEKEQMYVESLEYGFVFIDNPPIPNTDQKEESTIIDERVTMPTGNLKLSELIAIMKFLPLDITFVDAFDKVAYFNDRKERHFPRNKSIIGRSVTNCHPQKSVAIVEQILDAFKKGTKDKAEFWLNFNNTMLYITYYAVKNEIGEYIGTLEVSQDVSHIRSLQGTKTLLDWE